MVLGRFIGFYKQEQGFYGIGVNDYAAATRDACERVMRETANMSVEELSKSDKMTDFYEYETNLK